MACGTLIGEEQDHSQATLAPILRREDGLMDFSRSAHQIYDRWRGFQPWPGAYTSLRGKKLIVHRMHVAEHDAAEPGILRVQDEAMVVGCGSPFGSNAIVFDEVQVEGKRRMSAAEFLRGYQIQSGERLGLELPAPQKRATIQAETQGAIYRDCKFSFTSRESTHEDCTGARCCI